MIDKAYQSGLFEAMLTPSMVVKSNAPSFTIVDVNSAFAATTNLKKTNLINKDYFDAFPYIAYSKKTKANTVLIEALQEVINTKKPQKISDINQDNLPPLSKKSWETNWQIEMVPTLGQNGSVDHIFLLFIDGASTVKVKAPSKKESNYLTYEIEAEFQSLIDNIDGIVWESAKIKGYSYISPQVERILGYSPEEWLKDQDFWQNHIYDNDKERTLEFFNEQTKIGKNHSFEYRMVAADGRIVWLHDAVTVVKTKDNENILRGIMVDITQRKVAEQNMSLLINNTEEAFVLMDKSLNIVTYNDQFEKLYQKYFNASVQKGISILDYAHPSRRNKVKEIYDRVFEGSSEEAEITIPVTDTGKKVFRLFYKPAKDEFDNIIGAFVSASDITEKQKALEELQQNEARNKGILDSQTSYMIRTDLEGNYTYYNNKFFDDFGWLHGGKNLMGKNCMESIMEYHLEKVAATVGKCLENPNKVFQVEIDKPTINGGFCTTIWDFCCLTDLHGIPSEIQCVGIDITARTKAEQSLKNERNLLRTLLDNLPDYIFVKDKDHKHLINNQANLNLMGATTEEETIGKTVLDYFDPKLALQYMKDDQQVIDTRTPIINREEQLLTPNGENRWVLTSKMPLYDHSKRIIGLLGISRDITDRKKSEEQLRLMESVITNTSDAVMITEAASYDGKWPRIVFINEAYTRLTGYTAAEIIGETHEILSGEKTDSSELKRLENAFKNYESCEIETITYKKNGDEFWNNISLSPVANAEGETTHFIALERDISQRKNEELQNKLFAEVSHLFNITSGLSKSLQKVLNRLVKFGDFSIAEAWLANAESKKINLVAQYTEGNIAKQFNAATKEINSLNFGVGLAGQTWKSKKLEFWRDIQDDKRFIRNKAAGELGLKSGYGMPIMYNDEFLGVLVLAAGHEKDSKFITYTLSERFGNHLGSEIKRKQIEQELFQIFTTAPDIICTASLDGYFKKVNPAMCQILEYSEREIVSIPIIDFVHEDDKMEAAIDLMNLKQGENLTYTENRFVTKSGKVKWLAWTATPSLEDNVMYGIARDITEKKELEALLEKANSLAKIGGWEFEIEKGSVYYSKIAQEIFEIDDIQTLNFKKSLAFYKAGENKKIIEQAIKDAQTKGKAWDEELLINTAKGNEKWIRSIGNAEFINGKCMRLLGSVQDIHNRKIAEVEQQKLLIEKNTILESIGDAFFTVDKNWIISYWNKMAEKVLYKKKNETIGQNLWEVFADSKDSLYYVNYHTALKSNKSIHFEDYYPKTETWFEVSAYPSSNGLSVYFKDITLRKEVVENIRQSNERFEKIAEATNDAIWDYDILNDELWCGVGYQKLFGYDITKLIPSNAHWKSNIHPDDLPAVMENFDSYSQNKNVFTFQNEYRYKKADGTYAYVIDRGSIIRDRNGKATRMLGAMQDFTHRKKYEESLKHLSERLQIKANELAISNKELEQFAYVASHDLQEPLRMITSFLNLLQKKFSDQLDEKAQQYIFFATDGAKRMKQIILDLLEYSTVGKLLEENTIVDVNEVLEETIALYRKKIEDTNATIKWKSLPKIHAHKTPIRQLFQNLIGNCLTYKEQNVALLVEVSSKEYNDHWQFCVKDNGIGISEEYHEKIFIIFQRLHIQEQHPGTGMGLAICKKIVEQYNGKIWVESDGKKGSKFYFTIAKQ
ncbi:MAG: PAS domain S-box protein [Cyclobacteriaceae bacterium]